MLVDAWLARAAATAPARVAIRGRETELSYEQLEHASGHAARELIARGAGAGDRVAIALAPGVDFAIALHGCWRIGAVAVPVDLRLGEGERAAVARGALLVHEPLVEDRAWHAAAPAAPAWAAHDLTATAAVIHTSGTSGSPKAVSLSYGNWLWSALGSAVALGLDAQESWLSALPVAHVGGLSVLVRSAIYASTAVLHERFDAEAAIAELSGQVAAGSSPTLVSLVPTTLARLLDAGLTRPPRLRCALIGGAPVPAALMERARAAGVAVSQTYGLTEACSQVTTQPLAEPQGSEDAGPALFCTRVAIGDGEEILVSGPTVAAGAVAADGWLHTGDAGELVDGRLRVTGRRADTIVTGGENVAPAEVEAVLEAHPAVAEAAVVGRPDDEWGEAVFAIVVPRAGADPDTKSLRRHCAARLASFKVPKAFEIRESPLPRTHSGKLIRRGL